MTGHIRKRTTKSGTTWQIVLESGVGTDGNRKRKYITVPGTKKQAQALLNEKLTEYNKGTYIEPSKKTIKECLEEWLTVQVIPRLAPSTTRGYKVNIYKHTLPYIGHISIQKLTPVQVQEMYDQLTAKGLSSRSVRYIHTTLRAALEYAKKLQYTPKNAAEYASPPKEVKPEISVYTEEEILQLLRCAEGTRMSVPLSIAVELGLRRGELLAIKWSDINWDAKTLTIRRNLVCIDNQFLFGEPKTKSGHRTLLLSDALLKRLKKHQVEQNQARLLLGSTYHNDDLVCCKEDGNPYHTGSFSHKFNDFLQRNGLRHIRLHDLRHTNATLLLQYGVPAKIASQRLGHANISITLDTYSHVSVEMQEDAVNKLAGGVLDKLDTQVC